MDVLQWIAQYWVNWVCALAAGGVILFAKHYIKIQKESLDSKWKEKEKNMCGKIICTFEDKISEVENNSKKEDEVLHTELDKIHQEVDTIESGILSLQGRQFKDFCKKLLAHDHVITEDEFEEFEEEYEVYKNLGGNHLGDTLHDAVIKKVHIQMEKD